MRKNIAIVLCLFLTAGVVLLSCNKDTDYEQLRRNELALLADYVARYEKEHNVTLTQGSSGLYYIEIQKGTGDTIVVGDKVQVWYNTYLLKDTVLIDSNIKGGRFIPLEFVVTTDNNPTVIEALNEAVKNMQPGAKAFIIAPSEIAYGQTGSTDVPSFSTLLFDLEIYKVFKGYTSY